MWIKCFKFWCYGNYKKKKKKFKMVCLFNVYCSFVVFGNVSCYCMYVFVVLFLKFWENINNVIYYILNYW